VLHLHDDWGAAVSLWGYLILHIFVCDRARCIVDFPNEVCARLLLLFFITRKKSVFSLSRPVAPVCRDDRESWSTLDWALLGNTHVRLCMYVYVCARVLYLEDTTKLQGDYRGTRFISSSHLLLSSFIIHFSLVTTLIFLSLSFSFDRSVTVIKVPNNRVFLCLLTMA